MFSNGSSWLKRLVGGTRRPCKSKPRTQLNVEILEDRCMPSVTYGGGPLIQNVQVETMYYGSQWNTSSVLQSQQVMLNNYFSYLTNSSVMSLLGQYSTNGYTIGKGSWVGQDVNNTSLGNSVDDTAIQSMILGEISNGNVPAPNGNTLYFVFTQPGTEVTASFGNSISNFLGYHSAFSDSAGQNVYYAVIAYAAAPNSTLGSNMTVSINGTQQPINGFQQMTSVSEHELAEAITDPSPFSGWNDSSLQDGEIGDTGLPYVSGGLPFAFLNDFMIQALWSNQNNGATYPTGYATNGNTLTTLVGPSLSGPSGSVSGLSQDFSWSAIGGANYYDFLLQDTTTGAVTEKQLPSSQSSVTESSLVAGHSYSWSVRAYSDDGVMGNYSSQTFQVSQATGGVPAAPTNLTATAGNAQVSLSWTASSGATSYDIYRGTSSGGETLLQTGVTGTNFTDSGLNNGTSYYYVVTAVNAAGQSGDSNESSATPEGTLTGNAGFVEALYQDFLHRSGDTTNTGDAGYWVNALNNGSVTPAQVANIIAGSQEALTYQVDALYQNILGRQADSGGQGYFVNMLQDGGAIEQVLFDMLSSGEFAADAGSNAAFIQSLYSKVLARTASNPEVQGWVNALPYLGRTGVVYDFLTSAEFRGDAVTQLYDGAFSKGSSISSVLPNLLQRSPSSAEVGGWVYSGLSLLTIEVAFAGSNEFYNDNAAVNQKITYVPNEPSAGSTYTAVQGTLFGPNGPSYLDVAQGQIGDCWLLSSLAETAVRAPSDITSMFTYDGTALVNGATVGVYGVRFYDSNGTAHQVTVDTELPAGGGMYDRPVNGVLWVALAEKAYAEANGAGLVTSQYVGSDSYAALNEGNPAWALQAITGKPASSYSINPSDVAAAWNAGELVVIATPNTIPAAGLVQNHAYAVIGYDNSTQTFTVFNPWGTDSAGWVPGMDNQIYGRFNASGNYLYQNFVEESFGSGAANGTGLTGWQEMVGQFFLMEQQLLHHHS